MYQWRRSHKGELWLSANRTQQRNFSSVVAPVNLQSCCHVELVIASQKQRHLQEVYCFQCCVAVTSLVSAVARLRDRYQCFEEVRFEDVTAVTMKNAVF
jgi:protease II